LPLRRGASVGCDCATGATTTKRGGRLSNAGPETQRAVLVRSCSLQQAGLGLQPDSETDPLEGRTQTSFHDTQQMCSPIQLNLSSAGPGRCQPRRARRHFVGKGHASVSALGLGSAAGVDRSLLLLRVQRCCLVGWRLFCGIEWLGRFCRVSNGGSGLSAACSASCCVCGPIGLGLARPPRSASSSAGREVP